MKRWWIGIVIVLALVAVGIVMTLTESRTVQVAVVQRGEMYAFVEERGETSVPEVVRIAMPTDGRIQNIPLREGDTVDKGEVVARMVPEDLRFAVEAGKARVARLEAEMAKEKDVTLEETALAAVKSEVEAMDSMVEAAEEQTKAALARLQWAQEELERVENLSQNNAASAKEMRDMRYEYNDANFDHKTYVLFYRAMQALQIAWNLGPEMVQEYIDRKALTVNVLEKQKRAAEAELAQLELTQERGTLQSPVAGVVLHRAVASEQVLATGTLLLEIGRLEDLEIEVDVLTQDAVRVQQGQRVEIFGAALGDMTLSGQVARVYPEGFEKISSLGVEQQRVKVIVAFDEGEREKLQASGRTLGIGYRVRVRIFTARSEDALTVPRAALFRDAAGTWQVFAVRDGRTRRVNVKLGLINSERAEVTDGLNADDRVVLAPDASLTDGTRVEPDVLETAAE